MRLMLRQIGSPSNLFTLGVGLLLLSAVLIATGYPLVASLAILVVGGIGVILTGIELWKSLHEPAHQARRATYDTPHLSSGDAADQRRGAAEVWAWFLGMLVAIWLIGFVAAVPLFVFAYSKAYGGTWITSIGLALLVWAIVFGVFTGVVHVPWPTPLVANLLS